MCSFLSCVNGEFVPAQYFTFGFLAGLFSIVPRTLDMLLLCGILH